MELNWRTVFPVAAVLCWQTAEGTGGEYCFTPANGTGALTLVVEKVNTLNELAKHIESLRVGLRLSQADIAKIFGVSRQTVYNWLKGENIQAEHQRKIEQVIQSFSAVSSVLKGRKEFFNDRALLGEKNLVQLLAEGNFDAFDLLKLALMRSDERSALLTLQLAGKLTAVIPAHFDPLD